MSLSKAILEGRYEEVEKLLAQGMPVNIVDEYGCTPLIHASVTNRYDIALLLLKHNARTDLVDITGSTALHWAIDNNNIQLCKLLLNFGANPNSYTANGQPALFYPMLRKNQELIKLLVSKGANTEFAKDFIQAKLIGHRFELQGNSDLVNAEGLFVSIDLEGFYLEFTLEIIRESLERFTQSYIAHRMNIHEPELRKIIYAFSNASKLREFKHFSKSVQANQNTIDNLIKTDLLLLPVSYQGHAITFIKHGHFLAKCDRGVQKMTDPIVIHTIHNAAPLGQQFYNNLLYQRQTDKFMKSDIYKILELDPFAKLPIKHQITGNCSWANSEASVPTMLYMLLYDQLKDKSKVDALVNEIMQFYRAWLEWDRDRAIEDWLIDFDNISFQRQKSKAALLGAVLFQASDPNNPNDVNRARKILKILSRKEFHYIIRIYANIFVRGQKNAKGHAFNQLIESCGYKLSMFNY